MLFEHDSDADEIPKANQLKQNLPNSVIMLLIRLTVWTVQSTTTLSWHLPYLSVLKPGSNTRRGSNIRRVVQQNERNKMPGPI